MEILHNASDYTIPLFSTGCSFQNKYSVLYQNFLTTWHHTERSIQPCVWCFQLHSPMAYTCGGSVPRERPWYCLMVSGEQSFGMSQQGFTAIRMLATYVYDRERKTRDSMQLFFFSTSKINKNVSFSWGAQTFAYNCKYRALNLKRMNMASSHICSFNANHWWNPVTYSTFYLLLLS